MSKLDNDAIINVYIELIHKTQADYKLPEYSEIYLRLAFKEVYNKNQPISSDDLSFYRKLLVIYYSQQYPSLKSVINIMERCFTIDDINNIIAGQNSLLEKWREFQNNYAKTKNKSEKRKFVLLDEVVSNKK